MNNERQFIPVQNPLAPQCEEIQPFLLAYWTTPDQLATQSIALIDLHLQTCPACQAGFAAIMSQQAPPWKS